VLLINAVQRTGRRIAAITAILVLASCRSDLNDLIGPAPTASIGAIAVAVDSLPQGISASIAVTGAGGFHQEMTGAGMLSSLPPGTYTIVASDITIGSQHFTPVPATQTITIGNSTTALPVEITYVDVPPAVGSLTVSVGGLPRGTTASLTLAGPNGFSQQLTAAGSIGNLAPGSYILAAVDVVSGGITFQAQPASQTFTVAAGTDAAASVAYAAVAPPVDPSPTSSLALSVTGLPGGVSGDVQIAGPAGFTQPFGNSGTVAGLAPGGYTITAHELITNGTTYTAQPASQSVTLNGGATTSATIIYAAQPIAPPAVGTLALVVSGLPNGASGAVTVNGPAGFTHNYTVSTAINSLAPGSYTVTAAPVTAGGFAFAPTAPSQTVTIVSRSAAAAEVQYAGADGDLTVTIDGLSSSTPASVTVTGPNSYSQLLTATQTLTALAPGNYTITAATIWSGGYGYAATSPTQVQAVAAGSSGNATVAYAASTATLNLVVTGLPAGTGAITITGPGGFSQLSNGSQLLTGLVPGDYTLSAASATVSGAGYVPSPWNQSITLTAGATTPATVAYSYFLPAAPSTGSIAVTVTGLPGGVSGDVTVTGPALYSHHLTGSETLSALGTGAYSVVSVAVSSGGVTYNPSATTQSATIAGGSTTTVTVRYTAAAPVTGSLAVTLAGLPSGASGSVTVTGPGGYSQALTASQTLTGLAAGTYTIAAGALSASGFTWSATVLSQTKVVATGSTASATVTYTAVSATVSLTISGLPSSIGGSVIVTGPNAFSQTVTASQLLTSLAPGSYTITAANVTSGSTTYAATPVSQTKSVTAGGTTAASLTYAAVVPTTGALTVTVAGLPGGGSGHVTVTGPGSFTQALTATETLNGLTAGSYTVAAATVTSGATTYVPTVASQNASVTGGGTATVTVTYGAVAPLTGALTVTATGLPGGVSASITVTGPGSYSHAVTATQTLSGLTVGTYTISAASVTSGSTSYTASVSSGSVSVTGGGTATTTVTYSAPSGLPTLTPGYHVRTLTISAAQAGGTAQTFAYQIYVPTGYTPTRPWPIILTSSGSGEFGTNNTSQVAVGLGPHIAALGEQAIVVFPQWRSGLSVNGLRSLMEVTALRQTMAEVNTDSARIYATGNSSGGFQVWETLFRYPKLFAAGVSAAGGVNYATVGEPSVAAEVDALLPIPMWIFSADDDGTVPTATYFTPIVNEWTAKGSLGTLHQYTLYHAIGGHQPTWDTAFASAATWTWLFAQHR